MFGKFILLFIVWIGLTNSLDYQELIIGAVVSIIISYYFTKDKKIDLVKELIKYVKLTPLFVKNLIIANIEVAKIVLSPKINIDSKVIKLKLDTINDIDKLLIANAITLTPGTITIDIDNDDIYVHILDIKTTNINIQQEMVIDSYKAKLNP